MSQPDDLLQIPKQGDPITAEWGRRVVERLRGAAHADGAFTSGTLSLSRPLGGGSGSTLKMVRLTTNVSAGSVNGDTLTMGAGTALVYSKQGSDYKTGGSITVKNPFLTEIVVGTSRTAWVNDLNELVVVDCTEA